jgi:hypothetical protein
MASRAVIASTCEHGAILVQSADRRLPRQGGSNKADGGHDEKMQEFPENHRPRPAPRPGTGPQAPGPRSRAQQAADSALAAADAAIGVGSGAVGFTRSVFRLGRPLLDSLTSPLASAGRTAAPLAGRAGQAWPQPWLRRAAARGRQDREALTSAVIQLILTRVPGVASALLDQLDLTAVVTERVDVNAVAAQIDVDAVARRVDVVAILDRMDPAAVTRYLVEELDLPAIIQSSTGSIMSVAVRDVRMQSITADEGLSRMVDAVLLRRRARRRAAPGTAGPADPAEAGGPATTTGPGDGPVRTAG